MLKSRRVLHVLANSCTTRRTLSSESGDVTDMYGEMLRHTILAKPESGLFCYLLREMVIYPPSGAGLCTSEQT